MNARNIVHIIILMIAFAGLGANAAQQCYQCSGFDADKKTLVFTEFIKQFERDPRLPKPVQEECLTNPSNLVTCDSYCFDTVATINMKNMAGIDFGQANNEGLLEEFRNLGTARVAVRGCFDSFVNGTEKEQMKEYSKIFEMGKEPMCTNGNIKISGINAEGAMCFCQGDACNKKQPTQTIAVGDAPQPTDDAGYTSSCPAPPPKQIATGQCTKNCTNDSDCSEKKQLCCKVGCDAACSNPLYKKPFLAGSCSQVDFTEQKMRDLFDNVTKSEEFVEAMASAKMLFSIPPQSQECFTHPPTKKCETLAYSVGGTSDFTGIKKMSPEKIASLNKLFKEASKKAQTPFDIKAEEFGKTSMVMRGCAEDLIPVAFASGFPKIGPVSGTIEIDIAVVGAEFDFQLSICNTDECNLQPVVLEAGALHRDNGSDRPNAIQSTMMLILSVMLSFLLLR